MSTYGAETAPPEESQAAKQAALAKSLTLDRFLWTYVTGPWVLVENGSILGYFDWVSWKQCRPKYRVERRSWVQYVVIPSHTKKLLLLLSLLLFTLSKFEN